MPRTLKPFFVTWVKDGGRRGRAGTQHILERRVERNRIMYAEKLNAAAAEGSGIARYQLPVMLFAAKAQDSHAGVTSRKTFSPGGTEINGQRRKTVPLVAPR